MLSITILLKKKTYENLKIQIGLFCPKFPLWIEERMCDILNIRNILCGFRGEMRFG